MGGGVEGPGPPDSKKLGQRCFVIFADFLFSPSTYLTVLQRGPIPRSDGLFFGKHKFSKVPEGVQHFSGWGEGSNFFSRGGGSKC